ncbi:GMC oxidoreductase [Stereum hirsutum FP-91666 SS1]|uniref:GMC oxidoreductase n=1 Tax=Stereum hirsutum (strain FP-91666) TaxID=721885 RepID=R7RXB0_STEHR|nr:GMC oxidoreductase [Stereum hirsutum FP-91666 SS1]EIM79458.1 GMC oxidoreductase [Stereum hirsutum FP-91666 SS1]
MGSSQSYLTNPSHWATPVTEGTAEADTGKWKEYDYVIVGGGTAGCVLASRLSEDAGTTVLLIEAGNSHEKEYLTRIPLAWPKLLKSRVDWDYETTPQKHANDRVLPIPRGKVVGGTSSINALLFQHCAPEDFDEWVKLGAEGWSYEELRPYILKSEQFAPSPQHPGIKESDHGSNGVWKTGYVQQAPIHEHILDACEEVGVPRIPDLNTLKGPRGASTFTEYLDGKGGRHSPAKAYLTPSVVARPNLTIAVNTYTEKIIFSTTDKDSAAEPRAVGVQVSQTRNGQKWRVKAGKEVIVCCGVIATPQLLLLSGLGPSSHLSSLSPPIATIKDLPQVGLNYYDHISAGPLNIRAKPGYTFDYLNQPFSGLKAMVRWAISGTGPMAASAAPGAAFLRSDDERIPFDGKASTPLSIRDTSSGPNAPDIEILWFPVVVLGFGVPPPKGVHGVSIGALALKPESSGSVRLKTSSVYDKPLIDPNFLSSENDLNTVVRGVRFVLRLARTERMKGIFDLKPHEEDTTSYFWPGDADPDKITDEQIKAFVRRNCVAAFHPTSSCRISRTPETGAVDPTLRVHGVKGLRVCDASVFPTQMSGHPVAIVVAMAEKLADMIKRGE